MKTIFKTVFGILFFFISYQTFAQPAKGIKVGANYTFYKDLNGVEYSPLPGFQFGYVWSAKLNESLALSVEGLFTQKSSNVKYANEDYLVNIDEKRNAGYISLPLGLNYCLPKAYLGGGYQFGYLISGSLPVNEFDHALFLQAGYKIRFVDVVLKYAGSINKEIGGTLVGGGNYTGAGSNNTTYTSKANTFEFSLIFNLGAK
jgi:hypothetical protein